MSNTQKNIYKKLLGRKGELLAEVFLKNNGYKILKRNYVTKFGEADIIAEKNGEINFIEVKTRSNFKYGTPAQAVNNEKQRRYRDIANFYLIQNNLSLDETFITFGVIEVFNEEINFIENAF